MGRRASRFTLPESRYIFLFDGLQVLAGAGQLRRRWRRYYKFLHGEKQVFLENRA